MLSNDARESAAVDPRDATPRTFTVSGEGVRPLAINPHGDNPHVRACKLAALNVLWRVFAPARRIPERVAVSMLRVSRTWWRDRLDASLVSRHPAPLGLLFQMDEETFEQFVTEARAERARMQKEAGR